MAAFVTPEEYQAAKQNVIGGVDYKMYSIGRDDACVMGWMYVTKRFGNFYELHDIKTGATIFWSDKDPARRILDAKGEALRAIRYGTAADCIKLKQQLS